MTGHAIAEIYQGYMEIKRTWKRGVSAPVVEQVRDRFDLNSSEWSRIKIIFETAYRDGDINEIQDPEAAGLIGRVDAGQMTLYEAFGVIERRRQRDRERAKHTGSVRLRDVHQNVLRLGAFVATVASALRVDVPVNTFGMTDDDIAACIKGLKDIARNAGQAASALNNYTKGATTDDHDRPEGSADSRE